MSETRNILTLIPPKEVASENLVGVAQICPHCGGDGWFWGENPVTTESEKMQCTYCKGTGQIVPYVHIRWDAPMPSELHESKHNK